MAAYAALVTLSKAIHQILPYEQHYSFLCHKNQMQSLLDRVIRLQQFLEDVSGESSDGVDELESRIRDVAHRLEDFVESILVYSLAVEYQNEVNTRLSIQEANTQVLAAEDRAISTKSFFMGLANKLFAPSRKSAKDAESETETSLDDILGWCLDQDLENKAKYSHLPLMEHAAAAFGNCIKEVELLLDISIVPHYIATTSLSGGPPDANDTTVGLKDDLHKILDRITREQRALEVIPITGMRGIGKTTLARAVYDHHRKQDHFDLVLWATVSQQYNVKEILRVLCPENTESDAIVSVYKRLIGRRYLIILDDMWDETVWEGVRIAFPNDNNCSRVIVTTRLANLATYVSSSYTCEHQMKLLSKEHSWDLLRETVYGHVAGCPSEFEYYIGRRILGNCKGLPQNLLVIGGLLKLNNAEDHWEHVARSTTTKAVVNDESIPEILSLSYRNLPPHLKACFLYFGMFPEHKEIPTKELVRLWCAEGFLKPRESKTMEEVAEECLEELVRRNLVLVMKKRYNGKIKGSSIHDVLRDLCLRQAQNEKFLYCHRGSSGINNGTFRGIIKDQPRRVVSFPYGILGCTVLYNSPIRTLRTDQRLGMIPELKLVRVLGKVEFSAAAFEISVRMTNLRYLHLHKEYRDAHESVMVPKSISKLRNLETLVVSCGYYVSSYKYDMILPVEIWEMPRLRHLLVSKAAYMKLPPFPEDDSSTESLSLQTLTGLVNFGDFSPRVIQKLQQNLKKLQIKYMTIYDVDEEKVFGLENLVNLHHLEHLTIWSDRNGPRLRNIGFPINLKKLRLEGTKLPWEKMTSIGDLIHLEVLKLLGNSFSGEVWEPIEGGFPQLKYLKMEGLFDLEEWRAEGM